MPASFLRLAVHSIPVIITVFFIGIVIDKFGTQKTAVALAISSLLGAICVATGHRHFGILITGRLLFGFGSESMSVTAQKMLSQKFKDSILSLAFGFQIFWGQLGSCVVFVLMPALNDKFGTIPALWSVPICAVFSLLTTLAYYWIDVRQTADARARSSPPISPNISIHEDVESLNESSGQVTTPFMQHSRSRELNHDESPNRSASLSPLSNLSPSSSAELEDELDFETKRPKRRRASSRTKDSTFLDSSSADSSSAYTELQSFDSEPIPSHPVPITNNDQFELKDLKTLPGAFWVLLTLYFSVSTTYFVWNSFGGDRLHEKFGYPHRKAGMIVALSNLAAMASPLTGFIVDRIGHRTKFIMSGVSLMLVTYCAITWSSMVPTLWYIMLGLGVSLCQPIVFASVSLVVKDTITGTAFALMSLALNVGQVLMPVIVGKMRDKSGSYQTSNYVFVALAVVALMFAALLCLVERYMKVLDTVGLWRGTPPPSAYSEIYVTSADPVLSDHSYDDSFYDQKNSMARSAPTQLQHDDGEMVTLEDDSNLRQSS